MKYHLVADHKWDFVAAAAAIKAGGIIFFAIEPESTQPKVALPETPEQPLTSAPPQQFAFAQLASGIAIQE